MRKINIGIVDYDLGNHDSVLFFLKSLDFRVTISKDVNTLREMDLIVLPGVGAFPKAMECLYAMDGMVEFISQWSKQGNPLLGICLGMQLLCSTSNEFGLTKGLDLIPGEVLPLESEKWHIGWNDHIPFNGNNDFEISSRDQFYYNHSYKYKGEDAYIVSYSMYEEFIPAIIQKNKTVGIQFHPEKSQKSGKELVMTIIKKLVYG